MIEARALALKAAMRKDEVFDLLSKARHIESYLIGTDQTPVVVEGEKAKEDWWQAHQTAANPAVDLNMTVTAPALPSGEVLTFTAGSAPPVDEPEPGTATSPERRERKPRKMKAAKGKRGRPRKADKEAAAELIANGAAEHIAPAAEASPIPADIAA